MQIQTRWTGASDSSWCEATVTLDGYRAVGEGQSERAAIRRAKRALKRAATLRYRLGAAVKVED